MTTKIYTSTDTHTDYDFNERVSVFGGEDDVWGANLTPEILNSPGFTITFDAEVAAGTLFVDEVVVEVFFTLPAGQYDPDGLPPWSDEALQHGCISSDSEGNRMFVVVGKNGLVKTSHDGWEWGEKVSGKMHTLRAVAARPGRITAVGDNGTIITSSDGGETWVSEESATSEALTAVEFDGNADTFVAAGRKGVIRTSKAAAAWSPARK